MAKKEIGRPPTAHIPPFGLRLQPELKERVETAAKESGRSMNAEIVARLEASFVAERVDAQAARFTDGAQDELARLTEQLGRVQRTVEHINTKLNLQKRVVAGKPKP